MSSRLLRTHCRTDHGSRRLLESAIEKLGLSARAYNRVLKIARTIADLAGAADIDANHISEAIQYRTLDRGRVA
jgi:magnesium chelatase family protein